MEIKKSNEIVPAISNIKDGISLLDYFAAQAMNGILSNPNGIVQLDLPFDGGLEDKVVKESYKIAKTMMVVSKKNSF